jgi:hypothetical protein
LRLLDPFYFNYFNKICQKGVVSTHFGTVFSFGVAFLYSSDSSGPNVLPINAKIIDAILEN